MVFDTTSTLESKTISGYIMSASKRPKRKASRNVDYTDKQAELFRSFFVVKLPGLRIVPAALHEMTATKKSADLKKNCVNE